MILRKRTKKVQVQVIKQTNLHMWIRKAPQEMFSRKKYMPMVKEVRLTERKQVRLGLSHHQKVLILQMLNSMTKNKSISLALMSSLIASLSNLFLVMNKVKYLFKIKIWSTSLRQHLLTWLEMCMIAFQTISERKFLDSLLLGKKFFRIT